MAGEDRLLDSREVAARLGIARSAVWQLARGGSLADLVNAIHLLPHPNLDTTAVRKYLIGRAKALGAPRLIPTAWAADGTLKRSAATLPMSSPELEFEQMRIRRGREETDRRLSELRAWRVTERDRAELQWQARQQAPSTGLTEGDLLRLLTSRRRGDKTGG